MTLLVLGRTMTRRFGLQVHSFLFLGLAGILKWTSKGLRWPRSGLGSFHFCFPPFVNPGHALTERVRSGPSSPGVSSQSATPSLYLCFAEP